MHVQREGVARNSSVGGYTSYDTSNGRRLRMEADTQCAMTNTYIDLNKYSSCKCMQVHGDEMDDRSPPPVWQVMTSVAGAQVRKALSKASRKGGLLDYHGES